MVAALACSLGLHWSLLQSVAWIGMVIRYSHGAPLKEGLAKTFDGKHPCSLCKEIAKGKQSQEKSEFAPTAKKFEFVYSAASFVFAAPGQYWELGWPMGSLGSLALPPPVPPPRQFPG